MPVKQGAFWLFFRPTLPFADPMIPADIEFLELSFFLGFYYAFIKHQNSTLGKIYFPTSLFFVVVARSSQRKKKNVPLKSRHENITIHFLQ